MKIEDMTVTQIEALPRSEREEALKTLSPTARRGFAARSRMLTLMKAKSRFEAMLADDPDNPKAPRWLEKLGEFENSLKNLSAHGRERPSTDRPIGVDIDVPVGQLSARAGGAV